MADLTREEALEIYYGLTVKRQSMLAGEYGPVDTACVKNRLEAIESAINKIGYRGENLVAK